MIMLYQGEWLSYYYNMLIPLMCLVDPAVQLAGCLDNEYYLEQ